MWTTRYWRLMKKVSSDKALKVLFYPEEHYSKFILGWIAMWNFKNIIKSFTFDEMACKNCVHCGGVSDMDENFMMKLQNLRDACGFALPVNSGFRCAQKKFDCKGHEGMPI